MKKGFTLVEVMIVVAIIALLAAIAIPNLLKKANEDNARAVLKTISAASESFASENNGNYPKNWAALTNPDKAYLKENYQTSSPRQGYNFACTFETRSYNCIATPVSINTGTKTYTVQTGGALTSAEYSPGER